MFARYQQHYHTQSDIQHHLGLLFALAKGNVLELGTRSGVSTAALLAGVEKRGGHVWSVDIEDCSAVAVSHPQWTFIQKDSRDVRGVIAHDEALFGQVVDLQPGGPHAAVPLFDLILIDTEHVYEITQAELAAWHPYLKPGGSICLHDTETFPGVRRAAQEFADAMGWPITFVLPCHGMAIIERPIIDAMPLAEIVSTEGAAWATESTT